MERKRNRMTVEDILREKFLKHEHDANLAVKGFVRLERESGFMVLANEKTGETLAEMLEKGKLPKYLVTGFREARTVGQELSVSLITTGIKMTPDGFHKFAKKLGIPEADDLCIYRMNLQATKNGLNRFADKVKDLLDEL